MPSNAVHRTVVVARLVTSERNVAPCVAAILHAPHHSQDAVSATSHEPDTVPSAPPHTFAVHATAAVVIFKFKLMVVGGWRLLQRGTEMQPVPCKHATTTHPMRYL